MSGKVSIAAAYNGRIAAAQTKGGADKLRIQWAQNLSMARLVCGDEK